MGYGPVAAARAIVLDAAPDRLELASTGSVLWGAGDRQWLTPRHRTADGSSVALPIGYGVGWFSSDVDVAVAHPREDAFALVARAPGRATITARTWMPSGAVLAADLPVTVRPLSEARLDVALSATRVPVGFSARAVASLVAGDGASFARDADPRVSWSSSDPAVVTVSNAPATRGRLTARGVGRAVVRARLEAGSEVLVAEAEVEVTGATLVALTPSVTGSEIRADDDGAAVAVEGRFDDGSTLDVSRDVALTADVPARLYVMAGRAYAFPGGGFVDVQLRAAWRDVRGDVTVRVVP